MRTVLGVGKYAPLPGICGDLRWTSELSRQQTTPVRYLNLFHATQTCLVQDWPAKYLNGIIIGSWRSCCRDIKAILYTKPERQACRISMKRQVWYRASVSETYRTAVNSFDRSMTRIRTLGVAKVAGFNHIKKVGQRGSRFASSALD